MKNSVTEALEKQIALLSEKAHTPGIAYKNVCALTDKIKDLSGLYYASLAADIPEPTKTLKDLTAELSTLKLTEKSTGTEGQDASPDAANEEEPEVNAWDAYLQRKEVAAQIVAIIRENTDTLKSGLGLLSIVKDMLEKDAKI